MKHCKKKQGLLDAESEEEAKKRNKEFYQDILEKIMTPVTLTLPMQWKSWERNLAES